MHEILAIPKPVPSEAGGKSASEKARLRHGRVLMKQASIARTARLEKTLSRANSLQLLIDEFVDGAEAEVEVKAPDSDEEFWNTLPTTQLASFANLADCPRLRGSRPGKQSRLQRLGY